MAEDETDDRRPLAEASVWDDDELAAALSEQLSLLSRSNRKPAPQPFLETLSAMPPPTGNAVIVPGARDGFRSSFVPPRAADAPTESDPTPTPARTSTPTPTPASAPVAVPEQTSSSPSPSPSPSQEPSLATVAKRRSSFAPPVTPLVVSMPVAQAPILYDLVEPLPPPVVSASSNPFQFPPPTDVTRADSQFLPPRPTTGPAE